MKKTDLIFINHELIIKESYRIETIQYLNILYFIYKPPYTIIRTIDQKDTFINSSISMIINNLPKIFFYCNRTSIINLLYANKIECIQDQAYIHYQEIDKSFVIPRRKKKELVDAYIKVKTNTNICRQCISCLFSNSCSKKE